MLRCGTQLLCSGLCPDLCSVLCSQLLRSGPDLLPRGTQLLRSGAHLLQRSSELLCSGQKMLLVRWLRFESWNKTASFLLNNPKNQATGGLNDSTPLPSVPSVPDFDMS